MKGSRRPFSLFILIFISLFPLIAANCLWELPAECACTDDPSLGPSIRCSDIPLAVVFASLKNASLSRLELSNCSATRLDEAVPLASLMTLEMTDCGITGIGDNVLSAVADSLESLVLARNKLTTIPSLKFPKLISLNLEGNLINDVPEGAFSGLPLLRQLRLGKNQICSLSSMALGETKAKLELLDLSGNCLATIPAQSLRSSLRLMYLDLSSNRIAEIGNFNIMNLPVLRELRLSDNLLNKIMPMAFMNVPQLQVLFLKSNLLADIDGALLHSFPKLEILDARNNMLSKLPSFKELPQLKQIRLDGNLITRVDTMAFSSNPKLQLVSLQDNAISLIARNSFDSLDQLVVLLLANNSIKSLEQGMLDGMRNLQQLNLRNNSLSDIDGKAFRPLKQLTTLDLGHNRIKRIAMGAFEATPRLFSLDLSGNELTGFEKGTFGRRISNVLLDGNPLVCDEQLDWFIHWLVVNRVRTFLPAHQEIVCAGPPKMAGARLKDIMMKKASEESTIAEMTKQTSDSNNALMNHFLTSGLPALGGAGGAPMNGLLGSVPGLDALAQAVPALRGLNMGQPAPQTQPAAPTRTAGANIQAADVTRLMQALPSMIVNVPPIGEVDVKQLPPDLIVHVLRGGQIPGVPKETIDTIVQAFTARLGEMSQGLAEGPGDNDEHLPPLPGASVVQGNSLSGLGQPQMAGIRTHRLPVSSLPDSSATSNRLPINHQTLEMMKMLPPGYNMSRIPVQVMEDLVRGNVPDFSLLPADLQEHLKTQSDKMINMFARDSQGNTSIDALLAKLPKWERPVLPTYSPYDINQISNDLAMAEASTGKAAQLRFLSTIALGAIGAVSLIVIIILCIRRRRSAVIERDNILMSPSRGSTNPPPPVKSSNSQASIRHNMNSDAKLVAI